MITSCRLYAQSANSVILRQPPYQLFMRVGWFFSGGFTSSRNCTFYARCWIHLL